MASADWTATALHPAGAISSTAVGGYGNKQVGQTGDAENQFKAALWTGTAGSYLNLHPAGSHESFLTDCFGTKQVGHVRRNEGDRASMWTGTAGSWVNLHPAGPATDSYINRTDGTKQVGAARIDFYLRAAMWSGTAGSFVNLNPTGAFLSVVRDLAGSKQGGYAVYLEEANAILWSGSAASAINLNPPGANASVINAMTATKQGGYASFDSNPHAGIWSGTAASFVDLHPGGPSSNITDMWENTQVGYFTDGNFDNRACVWTGTAESMVNLHALLPAGYVASTARAIAMDGQNLVVIGFAIKADTEKSVAVIWRKTVDFTFALNKTSVAGQNSVLGTISLDATQPGATVFTTYDNSALVNTPATVTVAASTLVKNFQITVTAITSTVNTTIYAKLGAVTKSRPLTLTPLIPTAISVTPNPVKGGNTATAKIVVNGVAGPGGRSIAVFDNSPNTTMPSTVVVPAGASQVTFSIQTTAVTSQKNVTITARVSAADKTGTFRINP